MVHNTNSRNEVSTWEWLSTRIFESTWVKKASKSDQKLKSHCTQWRIQDRDPGPLMLGVFDRWTPTVNTCILQTQIPQMSLHIELCPIEARDPISLYPPPPPPLSSRPFDFRKKNVPDEWTIWTLGLWARGWQGLRLENNKYVLKNVILWKQRMHRRTETRVCKFSGPD